MVELSPSYMQELCYTAQSDRLLLQNMIPREGVANVVGGDLLVESTGGANLSVTIAQGGAFIQGDDVDDQGMYSVYNDDVVTLQATANGTGNPRIDTVIARVIDSTYGGISDEWVLEILPGTPTVGAQLSSYGSAGYLAGIGAMPDNAIPLAYVLISAGDTLSTVLAAADILDARLAAREQYDPWHIVGDPGEPAFQNGWVANVSGFLTPPRFRREGLDLVHIEGSASNGTATSTVFTLPLGYRPMLDDVAFIGQSGGTGAVSFHITPAGALIISGYVGGGGNGTVHFESVFAINPV